MSKKVRNVSVLFAAVILTLGLAGCSADTAKEGGSKEALDDAAKSLGEARDDAEKALEHLADGGEDAVEAARRKGEELRDENGVTIPVKVLDRRGEGQRQ